MNETAGDRGKYGMQAEIDRLRAALKEIADYATNPGDDDYMQRIARKALAKEGK